MCVREFRANPGGAFFVLPSSDISVLNVQRAEDGLSDDSWFGLLLDVRKIRSLSGFF